MKQSTKYNRRCLNMSKEDVASRLAAGAPNVVRLHVPAGETYFTDIVRGPIRIDNAEVDDQVLLKTDGFPTYHLANVVDDHLMEITHVIRAEEWISSTPKHVILYKAFGWTAPEFAHLPLLLNPDRSKLSKRQGDVAAEDYLAKGYLADALVNFVALMGFNPKADQEIYTLEELVQHFDLSKVNPSGAVFNREKLDWMNGMYMRAKPVEELATLCRPFLAAAEKHVDDELLRRILTVEAGRMTTLVDSVAAVDVYTTEPVYEGAILVWKKADAADAKTNLARALEWFSIISDTYWTVTSMEGSIKERIAAAGLNNGNVLWPLRVALSGREQSASPFELAWVLGREKTLVRIQTAIGKL
jgi:glutamyl-tRNA synthetase